MSQIAPAGAPTPRRSARLSQAGSVAGSVTGQSALTTVTTGGTRQRKKGPLTKVKPRKSNAYGASGRVGAAEELSVSTTGFAQAFQTQRGDAVTRDDTESEQDDVDELGAETPRMGNDHTAQRSPTTEHTANSRLAPGLSFVDSEGIAPSDGVRDLSIGNTSKSFGIGHEAGMVSPSLHQYSTRASSENAPGLPLWKNNMTRRSQMKDQAQNQKGTDTQAIPRQRFVQVYAVERKWLWKRIAMWAFGAFIITTALLFLIPSSSPSTYEPGTTSKIGVAGALHARISQSRAHLASWIMPDTRNSRKLKQDSGVKFAGNTGDTQAVLDDRIGDMRSTIAGLNDHLPEFVVIRRHPNGRREITDDFWNALMSKVKSSSDDTIWVDFLQRNKEKLRGILGVPFTTNESDVRPEAVSRQELLDMIQDQYSNVSDQIDQRVFEIIRSQASQIEAIAQKEARKATLDAIRLHSLAQSNLLASYQLNLRKPNYFSPGFGALVEPTFTSATYVDNNLNLLAKFSRRMALVPPRNPPKAALSKWEEPGDCWCSAPAPPLHGQAQLTVLMPRSVFPTQVTIEHLPMDMAPAKKITNAPRHIELWVETDRPVRPRYGNGEQMCTDGPAGWTCLGAFKYNIHASNHLQTFDLDAASSVPITKAMVRVLSNWGADHTCLYRVRLHGDDGEEDHKYDVALLDPYDGSE